MKQFGIDGITGGILDTGYLPLLSQKLSAIPKLLSSSSSFFLERGKEMKQKEETVLTIPLVQPLFRSCFEQYGFLSIEEDVVDLDHLIDYIDWKFGSIQNFILLGFSTGCQVTIHYLKSGKHRNRIIGSILHGPVSDRFAVSLEHSPSDLDQQSLLASTMVREKREEEFMPPGTLYAHPVRPERFLSMATRMGKEDMFSPDLADHELRFLLFGTDKQLREKSTNITERDGAVRIIPILVLLMGKDEYIPDDICPLEFFARFQSIWQQEAAERAQEFQGIDQEEDEEEIEDKVREKKEIWVDLIEIDGADHYCNDEKHQVELVHHVINFIQKLLVWKGI